MSSRVFIVDDQQHVREALVESLAFTERFEVVGTAPGEAEAKLWIEEHGGGWDLLIVDLILANGSGFEVLKRAKQLAPDAHALVFSGFVTEGVKAHCIALGADAVVDKLDPKALTEWLDAFSTRP